jgi:Cys-tRNA(Pro)/Cys-tRNA(Cys) deacylase
METRMDKKPEQIDSTRVTRELESLGVPHRLFRHPGPVHSLEQAARERGQKPEQVVRSIVFRVGKGEYLMVLAAGPRQVSWAALRSYLGKSRITMASEEEVRVATGSPLGAVSPFGLPEPMRLLIDASVLEQDEVSLGSGERFATIIMKRQDLLSALGEVETGDFLS